MVGLAVVALLAAAMSSLDSVINSLSATTLKDFVKPAMKERIAHASAGALVGQGTHRLLGGIRIGHSVLR